jgi:hypothetical protein
MKEQVSFRIGTREDDTQLVALFNATFRTPVSNEDWRWFSYDNPNGLNRVYILQDSENSLVGCYCVFPAVILFDGQRCVAGFPHHLIVRLPYRGAHIFVDFSRFVFEYETRANSKVLVTAPNKNSYLPHKMLAGWSDFGLMDCLYKLQPQSRSHRCKPVEVFTSEFEDLFITVSKNLAFCFEKSVAWLNWRYSDRPSKPYTRFAFYESSKLEGFIVIKRWQEPDGYRKAHIMDLWALTDNAVSQLLAAAETYAADCNELNLWSVTGYPYRNQLEANGFVARESARQPIIARALTGENMLFPMGAASFMYGDGDGY